VQQKVEFVVAIILKVAVWMSLQVLSHVVLHALME
jgi:hypothetical protein